MNTLRIPYRGKVYYFQFASNWDELKPKTLHKLLPLIAEAQAAFHIYQEDNYKEAADLRLQELRIKIVWLLLDLPWYAFLKKRAFLSLFADELSDILDDCDYLLEQPQQNTSPLIKYTIYRLNSKFSSLAICRQANKKALFANSFMERQRRFV